MARRWYLLLVSWIWVQPVFAQAPASRDGARSERLQGLSSSEIATIEPQLARGPVALVEFADGTRDELPAINLAVLVHAPAEQVLALARKPTGYPAFMRTLDEVRVLSEHGTSIVYDWNWQLSMFRLAGRNVMRVYAPPGPVGPRGYRLTIDNDSGDLGTGRMSIRILPRAHGCSLLIVSTRMDLRDANYLARKVARAARSVNRTANMSLAFAMALGLQQQAQRAAGFRAPTAVEPALAPLLGERQALPLLERGDLIMTELEGAALQQLWVYGRVARADAVVQEAMRDAHGFGSTVIPGSKATVVEESAAAVTFDWAIDLPLVGIRGRMHMQRDEPEISVTATAGALEGGRWRFRSTPLSRNWTLVSGWARFDLHRTNWLLRQIVDADPNLAQGLTAASEIMIMRALRSRAYRLARITHEGVR